MLLPSLHHQVSWWRWHLHLLCFASIGRDIDSFFESVAVPFWTRRTMVNRLASISTPEQVGGEYFVSSSVQPRHLSELPISISGPQGSQRISTWCCFSLEVLRSGVTYLQVRLYSTVQGILEHGHLLTEAISSKHNEFAKEGLYCFDTNLSTI